MRRLLLRWLTVPLLLVAGAADSAAVEKRVALVIGNSAYRHAEQLPHPRKDATDLAEALIRIGFEVDLRTDLDQLGMQHALRDFGQHAEAADVALVFYAGHAVQVGGENYLLPVDARLERERDLLYETLPLALVMGEVAQAQKLGLLILDACRDNPLAEQLRRSLGSIRSRLVGDGLARPENLPSDTMIAFATRPGEVAVDGSGEHSPYTAALLQHLEEPGVELQLLFRQVRDTVLVNTAYRQEPRIYDALSSAPFHLAAEPRPSPLRISEGTPKPLPGADVTAAQGANATPSDPALQRPQAAGAGGGNATQPPAGSAPPQERTEAGPVLALAAPRPPPPKPEPPVDPIPQPLGSVEPRAAALAEDGVVANPPAIDPPVVAAATPARPASADPLGAQRAERRVALVVGNSAYEFGRLANPANDAQGIATALSSLGFEARLELDLTRDGVRRAVNAFSRDLAGGGVGLFYYAGHAIQLGGHNYLIPIDASVDSEDVVPIETVDLDEVLLRMGATPSRLNIVVLDACRDNPFARSFRSINRGLAATPAPAGTFIAYATSPGGVASDGDGPNSPYTEAVLQALTQPGLRLEDVFKQVLAHVRDATDGRQMPWTSASIVGDFYFRLPAAAPTIPVDYSGQDVSAWHLIKNSTSTIDFESYLEAFAQSPLAPMARSRLRTLEGLDRRTAPAGD